MQQLRGWVPGPVGAVPQAAYKPIEPRLEEFFEKDIAFCSELAVHGGVAVSEQGFAAEAELLRMRKAGLLELKRDEAPPFGVTRVALSPAARDILSRRCQTQPIAGAEFAANVRNKAIPAPESSAEQRGQHKGFEVARGMISAAIKAEFATWSAEIRAGGSIGFEARIMSRIHQIKAPFLT